MTASKAVPSDRKRASPRPGECSKLMLSTARTKVGSRRRQTVVATSRLRAIGPSRVKHSGIDESALANRRSTSMTAPSSRRISSRRTSWKISGATKFRPDRAALRCSREPSFIRVGFASPTGEKWMPMAMAASVRQSDWRNRAAARKRVSVAMKQWCCFSNSDDRIGMRVNERGGTKLAPSPLRKAGGGDAWRSKVVRGVGGAQAVSAGPTRMAAALLADEGFGLAMGDLVDRVMG